MSWKVIKRYFDYTGITVKSPRESFREAYAQGIIESEDIWLEMIENRNLTSHIYDEFEIMPIIRKMGEYEAEYRKLREYLQRIR